MTHIIHLQIPQDLLTNLVVNKLFWSQIVDEKPNVSIVARAFAHKLDRDSKFSSSELILRGFTAGYLTALCMHEDQAPVDSRQTQLFSFTEEL